MLLRLNRDRSGSFSTSKSGWTHLTPRSRNQELAGKWGRVLNNLSAWLQWWMHQNHVRAALSWKGGWWVGGERHGERGCGGQIVEGWHQQNARAEGSCRAGQPPANGAICPSKHENLSVSVRVCGLRGVVAIFAPKLRQKRRVPLGQRKKGFQGHFLACQNLSCYTDESWRMSWDAELLRASAVWFVCVFI